MKKICHISTVHSRYDVRVFQKECRSLADHYDVYFIVADGLGDEEVDSVKIVDIGLRQNSEWKRATIDSAKALEKALALDCELYHFHDPELVRIGVKLTKHDKKVVYDIHEDLPRTIHGKPYLPKFSRKFVSILVEWQENKAARQFDALLTATPFIRERFAKINRNSWCLANYPILGELFNEQVPVESNVFCYAGGISHSRCIIEMIKALEHVDARLVLAGPIRNPILLAELKALPSWDKVEFLGHVERSQLVDIMSKSIAGLVLFKAEPNHVNAQPNKLFEYMSSKTAIIGSAFPLWEQLIVKSQCGLCVNQDEPRDIAVAMQFMIDNNDAAKEMGANGYKAVQEEYNWKTQEALLLEIYAGLLA